MSDLIMIFIPTDWTQGIFLLIMTALSVLSIVLLRKNANEKSWEKEWTNHTSTKVEDDVGVEHGSAVELAAIVATKTERLSEALPGAMITLGLLGTFFGLTQSLGSAAQTIGSSMQQIQSSSSNFSGVSDTLSNMLNMLKGMGTQFKTSIWGIIWFLSLRMVYNAIGFAGKRLRWTITKMKLEHQAKQEDSNAFLSGLFNSLETSLINQTVTQFDKLTDNLSEKNHALIQEVLNNTSIINKISDRLQPALETHSSQVIDALEAQNKALMTAQSKSSEAFETNLTKHTREEFATLRNALLKSQEALTQSIGNNISAITGISDQLQPALEAHSSQVINAIKTQGEASMTAQSKSSIALENNLTKQASKEFAALRDTLSKSQDKLTSSVLSNTEAIKQASNSTNSTLKTQIRDIISTMELHNKNLTDMTNQCLSELATLIFYVENTEENTRQFTSTIKTFAADVQGSIAGVKDAAELVKDSALSLSEVVTNLDSKIDKILSDMSTSITDTIVLMSDSLSNSIDQTKEALTGATEGISREIQNISNELGSKIESFDKTMREATGDLSVVIKDMQESIKSVLGNVQTQLSSTIQEMNESFSQNLEKNAEDFEKSVGMISQAVEKMSDTMDSMLNDFSREMSNSSRDLSLTVTEMRDTIDSVLGSFKKDIMNTITKMDTLIDRSTKSLEQSVENISKAANTMEDQIKQSFLEFNKSMETLIGSQKKALKEFDSSMGEITENIGVMTGEFKKLEQKLEMSLSTVSSSNRDLKNSLGDLRKIHDEHKELVETLEKTVEVITTVGAINEEMQSNDEDANY